MSWRSWALGFAAGAVLASYLTLSCGTASSQSAEVAQAIHTAALRHNVSEQRLRCLAFRESSFQPWAYNRAGYHGLYQFDSATFRYGARLAGLEDASPYDPWAAAEVTALLISRGEGYRWPPLRWC